MKALAEFNIDYLWGEILNNVPMLVKVLNAVAGQTFEIKEIKTELKVKYCFIYSILMNTGWNELSLFQRINSIMAIEGGCSKKVCIILLIFKLVSWFLLFVYKRETRSDVCLIYILFPVCL